MQSRLGGFVTVIIYLCVLMYASLKFSYFITRNNPNMFSYIKDENQLVDGEEINLSERNFRIAFTIEDFGETDALIKQKNDEKYVKWLVRLVGKREGKYYERVL